MFAVEDAKDVLEIVSPYGICMDLWYLYGFMVFVWIFFFYFLIVFFFKFNLTFFILLTKSLVS